MDKIQLVCPSCRSRLSVLNEPGLQDKVLGCPICKFKAKVSVYQSGAASRGGHGASSEDTRFPGAAMQMKSDVGQMRIAQTGQIIELRMGSQTIGRLANPRRSDVQIGSDNYTDPYMSRLHVQIDIVQTAAGIQHHMREIGSKNIIKLNGKDIQRGEIIVLQFGDKITLGKTDLVLEETDDDATRIM